jgi:hypothetical protein
MSGTVEKLLFTYFWNRYQQQIPDNKLIQIGAISILLCQHWLLYYCWKDIWCWKLPCHGATSESDRLHIYSLWSSPDWITDYKCECVSKRSELEQNINGIFNGWILIGFTTEKKTNWNQPHTCYRWKVKPVSLNCMPAWPGGTARGLPRRRSRVWAPKPRHSFLSPYLQLSLDLSLPGQITPDQVPSNKKKNLQEHQL